MRRWAEGVHLHELDPAAAAAARTRAPARLRQSGQVLDDGGGALGARAGEAAAEVDEVEGVEQVGGPGGGGERMREEGDAVGVGVGVGVGGEELGLDVAAEVVVLGFGLVGGGGGEGVAHGAEPGAFFGAGVSDASSKRCPRLGGGEGGGGLTDRQRCRSRGFACRSLGG